MENVIVKTLDNRALVLALDYLYKEEMKRFEAQTLLGASKILIEKLALSVIDVPVEGYYYESDELKEYFLNVRSLQHCDVNRKKDVEGLDAYQLFSNVMSSKIYGSGKDDGFFPKKIIYENHETKR